MTRPTATRLTLQPLGHVDPRTTIDERALVLAERNAYPVVARSPARRDTLGLAGGGAVALLLGGVTFWSMGAHRTAVPVAPTPVARPLPIPFVPAAVPVASSAPVPHGLTMPAVPSVAMPMKETRSGPAPTLVFDAGAPIVSVAPPVPGSPANKSATGGSENDQFASRLSEGEVPVATAQQLSDPATTVTQGTLIPAVLETAIDTDLPGYVRAVVSRDVRSFDGTHVLIPRSSRLIGQYKSGLAAGQTRAYVIWSRLIRPDGASVALGSPAVDFAGTSGLAGKVDGHFMKRFGSAVLLSVVGGLGALGGGGTSVVLAGGGQSAAAVAAQRDTAIPPTIRVAQGQPIRIFTAKDLDFSSVTEVASR